MNTVSIGGHGKMYRDLHVTVDGEWYSMEDLHWGGEPETIMNVKGLTPAQVSAIGKFGSGDFTINVAEDGTLAVVLE